MWRFNVGSRDCDYFFMQPLRAEYSALPDRDTVFESFRRIEICECLAIDTELDRVFRNKLWGG